MAAAKSSSAKKRRSSSTVAVNTDAAAAVSNADGVKISGKKRRVAPSKTAQVAAPLSAVAARRLAAAKALEEQVSQEQSNAASSNSTASVVQDDAVDNASQKSASEDSEAGDDEDDEDDEPVASTSKEPYTALKIHDGRPKRYFLGGAASLDSSTAPSPAAEDNPAEVSFAPSEGEYINTEDVSRSDPAAYSKRPSRRRRRAENAANFYLDPMCTSTWRPTDENHQRRVSHGGIAEKIIGMYPGETIVLHGSCGLRVTKGSISIDCAIVKPSSVATPIFAPSTHPLPTIRALRSAPSGTDNDISSSSVDLLEQPIIISLQNLTSGIEGIEALCRTVGMPIPYSGMWHLPSRWSSAPVDQQDSYKILLEPERDLCASIMPNSWLEALQALPLRSENTGEKVSFIVQGPKGVGKSTFSKLLVNSLLSSHPTVAYLDCDLGQPEYTPAGFLSLSLVTQPVIGPSFTHLHQKPVQMHYLGSTTPKDDPSFYIWAVSDLFDQYSSLLDQSDASIPLVINTQGWYKGLGADLLLEIHRMAQPGKCFDFTVGAGYPFPEYDGRNVAVNMPVVDPATETQVVPMQPYTVPENGPPRINASDLRMLQLISYFHLLPSSISTSSTLPSWDFSTSLVTRAPYAVPFSALQSIRIATSSTLSYADLLRSLDVSVVALREEEILQEEEQEVAKDPLQKAYERGFQQRSGRTLGLAIIRSIDSKLQHFHILTPVPPSMLERVNAIVKGEIEVPTVLMLDNPVEGGAEGNGLAGVEWKRVPYLEYGENVNAGVGHGRRRVRRNVMRKSQFR